MRHLLPPFALLLAAGCATAPKPVATPATPVPAPARTPADLAGLDAAALNARFGAPRLQVVEGSGIKLQYARGSCLLDAYLYPPAGGGAARVVHVDTRDREGRSVGQAGCVAMLEAR